MNYEKESRTQKCIIISACWMRNESIFFLNKSIINEYINDRKYEWAFVNIISYEYKSIKYSEYWSIFFVYIINDLLYEISFMNHI